MPRSRSVSSIASAVMLLAVLPACQRSADERGRPADKTLREDVKDVGRATEKAAKDLGHAAAGAADRAGQGISEAGKDTGKKVSEGSQDAWITTAVKSELTAKGFDPLRVHVDTDRRVVTLSGKVASAGDRAKAVEVARGVKDVASVADHLFVGPP